MRVAPCCKVSIQIRKYCTETEASQGKELKEGILRSEDYNGFADSDDGDVAIFPPWCRGRTRGGG